MTGKDLLAALEAMPTTAWDEGPTPIEFENQVIADLRASMIHSAETEVIERLRRGEYRDRPRR